MMITDRATKVAMLTMLLAGATFVGSSTLLGQEPGRVPLFLAIPQTFPEVDARAVLLREPGRDIVLLKDSDASVETLTVALHLLLRLNERVPRREGQGQMVPISGYVQTQPLNSADHVLLDEALTRLKARPAASIGNLGWGRSMPFRLPDR